MTVEELIIYGQKYIHTDLAKMLLANLLNLNTLELLNHLDDIVDEKIIDCYKNQIEAVKSKKPIQYVIGNVDFYGNIFKVNENVLIPRFETEELVEKTIEILKEKFDSNLDIVDLGTGTGCIAITLKKYLNANIDAVDISDKALELAKENALNNDAQVNFYLGDMLEPLNKKYDCIISNPPYIAYDEEIMDIVKNNEPHLALYADNNGLYFYEKILKEAKEYLKDKNLIAFEIGQTQGEQIKEIAKTYFPNSLIKIEKDMAGLDRFVFVIND